MIDAKGDEEEDGGQHPSEGGPSEAQQQPQGVAQQEPQGSVGPSGSTEPSLCHFLTDKFARQHLRLDQMSTQHSQDYAELIRQYDGWDHRQRNLEHYMYYAYDQ